MPRRPRVASSGIVVPEHLENFLTGGSSRGSSWRGAEGAWAIFDAKYLTRPELMPPNYEAAVTEPVSRYAVARVTRENVRCVLVAFTHAQDDRVNRQHATAILNGLNSLNEHHPMAPDIPAPKVVAA